MSLYLIDTAKLSQSNFLDQNNPKYKYQCKNDLIYIRDFEAVQKLAVVYYQVEKSRFASSFQP